MVYWRSSPIIAWLAIQLWMRSCAGIETLIFYQPYISTMDPAFQLSSLYTAAVEFNSTFAGVWGVDVRYVGWGELLGLIAGDSTKDPPVSVAAEGVA
ncbi:hypothetical protein M427DRAFT_58370 [Gonapodya prolifera JEL478]|uniref:Uncharacterized protein n=1 Tax=Gonapodya prolifera (strain JEL478) TaxID=1344416 RepID=A0A139AAM0_GONPJ|nr:hypothetical protein M427DRAFT_58370 [Gonapodya prolifera JEL478]|eukprot:KXS13777.1 hypothetical protein M427DRAFT_58370 [Gonapodya prolifera JEL478]